MSTKKKKCTRVTLKVQSSADPVIITTSNIPSDPMVKKNTKFGVFQNTSDLSNPRLCDQKILTMDCDGVQSVGKSWETRTYGAEYMLGVVDPDTKEMTMIPASLINLQPYVQNYGQDEPEDQPEVELTNFEQHKKIMMKFGGNKIRRSLGGKERMRFMEENTLDEAMGEAIESAQQDNLNLTNNEADNGLNELIPPINLQAKTLEEVFALEGIISQDELQTLRPYTDVLRACTTANIDTWRDQKLYPVYVLDRLSTTMFDEEEAHLHLSSLLYISYLVTLLQLPRGSLHKRTDNFPNAPQPVIKSIYKKFTESGTTETNNKKEQRTTISSKLRLKTIYYILALTLITDNYSVNFDTLCRDLNCNVKVLTDSYRSIGCTISKLKTSSKTSSLAATIKLPVKLPKQTVHRVNKKKEKLY